MEWTPARIRLFRETGLCLPQDRFAKALGFTKRTIGNAERGTHPPSLALRRALDEALEKTTNTQRTRFLAAAAEHGNASLVHPSRDRQSLGSLESRLVSAVTAQPLRTLDGLRSAVLDKPLPVAQGSETYSATGAMTATVQAHRLYHLADYDATAQLLPAVLTCLQSGGDTSPDEHLVGTLTGRHVTAAAYLVAAKLATKLGDVGLASVTADRAMRTAKETEHPALIGAAIYQVACALLLTGELADAEQILAVGAENIATVSVARHRNWRQEEALSVRGSLLLLLAVIAARRGDHKAAQKFLRDADQLAEQVVSRNKSARRLLSLLLARESRSATPGLRGLASRTGLLL